MQSMDTDHSPDSPWSVTSYRTAIMLECGAGLTGQLYLTHSERRPPNIPKRKSTSIVSSNWQHKLLYFHYKSVKLDGLCRQNKIWTFGNPFQSKKLPTCTLNSDLQSLYMLPIEDSQIILPKIIPMSHRNI